MTSNKMPIIELITLLLMINNVISDKNNTKAEKWSNKKYDFVIIGAGAAGSVLASRLSEVKDWKILLLEAGQTEATLIAKIPSMAPSLQLTNSSWRYYSEPEPNKYLGLNHHRMLWSSGKCLGGSSTINYMMYTRGHPADYDKWAQTGNTGWSYKDVLPYFLKSERANLEFADKDFHNRAGKLSVEYSHSGEQCVSFLKAAKQLGFNMVDYNGRNQIGFSSIQATLRNGARHSVADAFLSNLTNPEVVLGAHVTKIIIDPKLMKAKAVKFSKHGKIYRVAATKEIISCAGTFNSAQLLMLSGIGPKAHLEKMGISPIIKDLPVGQSLGDHIAYLGLNFISIDTKSQLGMMRDYFLELPYWYMTGKGVLSSLGGFEAVGFTKLSNESPPQQPPDIEVLFLNSVVNSVVKRVANINETVYRKLYNNTRNSITSAIYPVLLHPKSRGKVLLKTKRPLDPPILTANFFSHPDDVRKMIAAIRWVLKMLDTPEFRRIKMQLNPNPVPGCQHHRNNSDEYWECAVRTLATTSYDQFGTCKMGSANNSEAVVDDELRVHGLKNLRIVDASVIPESISGHLLAPTIMIAERASDFIKKNYNFGK